MTIYDLYLFLNYLRRKDPSGGSASPPEFNQNCWIAAFKFFKKIMGLPEQFQKGARDPVIGYGTNDLSEERIRPLKVLPTALTIDAGGLSDYPTDYFRHGPCYHVYTIPSPGTGTRNIAVPFVNDAKFNERRTTVLDVPSGKDPVANLHKDKIRFLPLNLASAMLEYIKYPTTPVMGYVIDYATTEVIYVDHGAYIQILTPGTTGNEITAHVGGTLLGSSITQPGDTKEDVMLRLTSDINIDTLGHHVKAVYDGEKVVLIDLGLTYTTLTTTPTGSITLNKANFTAWSVQFDWEDDIDAMTEISEFILDQMGISNRDMNLVQWSEKEKAK